MSAPHTPRSSRSLDHIEHVRSRTPVHFWPGPAPLHRSPGGRPPCHGRGAPLLGTGDPSLVTCKRCKASSALPFADLQPGPWSRVQLVAAGLLDPLAPEPIPPAAPYRNPNLAPRGGPLVAMVERWERLASGRSESCVPVANPEARAAFKSCAAELADALELIAGGGSL